MGRSNIKIEASPGTVRRLAELEETKRANAGLVFRNRWRCDDPNCEKGLPHGRWTMRHARGAQVLVDEPNRIFYAAGGRGSGKTWAGARNLAEKILSTQPEGDHEYTAWGVIGPSFLAAKTVCIESESGLLRALKGFVETWNRSEGLLRLTTGAVVYVDGASDEGTRIQGKHLYGAWCDEVGLWQPWERAWRESLMPAVHLGPAWVLCTGTPKPSSLVKELLGDPETGRVRWRTVDNLHNLSDDAVDWYRRRYEGTRLGRQELEGLLVEDIDGALWTRELLDSTRVEEHEPGFWQRKVVALDPAGGFADGDEQGLCVVGHSAETHELYVLESGGYRLKLWDFLKLAVEVAQRHEAMILLERDAMDAWGVMLRKVIEDMGAAVYMKTVRPQGSKRVRAEPVAAIFEQGRAHFVGYHPELEDQCCTFTGVGREPSPDRLDAMVHAMTEFVSYDLTMPDPSIPTGALSYSDEPVTGGAVAWS